MSIEKPPKTKPKPDKQFDVIVLKMMTALAFSVAFLFGGGTIFVYAVTQNLIVEPYSAYVGSVLGIHIAVLMIYYALSLFKYIVSD